MIRNLLDSDEEGPEEPKEDRPGRLGTLFSHEPEVISLIDEEPAYTLRQPEATAGPDRSSETAAFSPPTSAQSVRMTGLAWSAGISLFGSIVFMLILGWFADLLLDSSPWGKVAGIVLGSLIGFIQFFRINSEIFRSQDGPK